ncbi:Ig-like domain-containing protein [Clostridium estertheticum]|uniref:Ig-like domain-containing protein n=1 Tax=Clostridium estertheticum TaxID=238834 RepID=UPI001C0B294F|nr:hypothetical protein [Clostridium estertheticum]MBU3173301.1 hypothetical protein [Clostridium estertheticum]
MKIYKTIGLLICVVLFNLLSFNSVSAQVLTKQIPGDFPAYMPAYRPASSARAVNGDIKLGSKEIWQYTGKVNDQKTRFADKRTGGNIVTPPGWIYVGGTTTVTTLPPTFDYVDADGFSGTLHLDTTTDPYYGWDRYLVMGYNGLNDDGTTAEYTFNFDNPVPGQPNLVPGQPGKYYNGSTLEDIGVYSGSVTKTIGDPVIPTPPPNPTSAPIVNVHYQNSGVDIAPVDTFTPSPGFFTATAKAITNYTLMDSNTKTIAVALGQTYNIYFDYNFTGAPSDNNKARLLQYFVDQDGKEVFPMYDNYESLGEEDVYNHRPLSGYDLEGKNPRHINNIEGQIIKITWVYDKIVPHPPYVYLKMPTTIHQGQSIAVTTFAGDPKGLPITYTWTTSDGQVIVGAGGKLIVGAVPITVSVYVTNSIGLSSSVSTSTVYPTNEPPIIILNATPSVYIGEDVKIESTIFDPDGDPWSAVWTTPPSMHGSISDNGESTVYFNNSSDVNKTYDFTVTATDKFGLSTTKTVSTTILSVKPTATISLSGTQKENRLQKLTTTDSGGNTKASIITRKFEFVDKNNNSLIVDNNPTTSNVVKTLESLTNSSLNFLIKKEGIYIAKYTVTNNFGVSTTITQEVPVSPDIAPTSKFTISGSNYADKKVTDAQGHSLFSKTLTDSSFSNDGDTIIRRVWLRCWDSNNNNKFDDDFEVYSSGEWQPLGKFTNSGAGTWYEIAKVDLSKVNDGNCTSVPIQSAWVGNYYYYQITQEAFGQPTIPQLITNADYKKSDTSDITSMPTK